MKIPTTPAGCRKLYVTIRSRSEARSPADFDTACRAEVLAGEVLDPSAWVKAARKVRFFCGRCAGTGRFITMVENGQPKGPGGMCFRCAGRGTQDDGDALRNAMHDRFYMGRACG